MAKTKDYLDLLDAEVEIAPAGTQEEADAAQTISDVFMAHGLKPEVQDFGVSGLGYLPHGIALVLVLVGVLLAGLGGIALAIVGFLLAGGACFLLSGIYTGSGDLLGRFGSPARSQNVIALHKATGPAAESNNRPIVILAHYDTQHLDPMYGTPLAPFKKTISTVTPYATVVAAVCAFIQILAFLPSPLRKILWIVGLVAALPALVWGVSIIVSRFMPYAQGAVDNKSSLGAMFSVLGKVSPEIAPIVVEGVTSRRRRAMDVEDDGSEERYEGPQAPVFETYDDEPVVEVEGVRHGAEVLSALGILSPECEISYVDRDVMAPEPVETPGLPVSEDVADASGPDVAGVDEVVDEKDEAEVSEEQAEEPAEDEAADSEVTEAVSDEEDEPSDSDVTAHAVKDAAADEDVAADDEPEAPAEDEGAKRDSDDSAKEHAAGDTAAWRPVMASPRRLFPRSETSDRRAPGMLDSMRKRLGKNEESAAAEDNAAQADPDATLVSPAMRVNLSDDPEWGKSSFQPGRSSSSNLADIARKASELDLPDNVANTAQDAVRSSAVEHAVPVDPSDLPESEFDTSAIAKSQMASNLADASRRMSDVQPPSSRRGGDDERSGRRSWRGGAVASQERRDGNDELSDEEALEAVEALEADDAPAPAKPDENLLAHDIWFVATGASSRGHAGIEQFVSEHRKSLRGAFVINLECIGAGQLALLTREGFGNTRKADRRLVSLLASSASDLGIDVAKMDRAWADTEATVPMRKSLRSVTLMGMDPTGLPACSRTAADAPENVDEDQVDAVAELICEAIRRS